ncbi:MAG: hypothetical protein GX558_07740 [Clostridiales bacterium]|nr:hypothetical protein [Clostridiales bacterium]
MKRWFHGALALAVALALLALPGVGLAAEHNRATLTIYNPSIDFGGVPMNIEADVTIDVGFDAEAGRGMYILDVNGAGQNALNALVATEDGKLKAYLQNASGGLPYLLEMPLAELVGMAGSYAPAAPTVDTAQLDQLVALIGHYQAFAAKAEDPAFSKEFDAKVNEIATNLFNLELSEKTEQIEIFGETIDTRRADVTLTLSQAFDLLNQIAALDDDLKALMDGYFQLLSSASGEAFTMDSLDEMMKEEGVDVAYDITIWDGGNSVRMIETIRPIGDDSPFDAPVTFAMDMKVDGDDTRMAMTVDAQSDDKPVQFTMDMTAGAEQLQMAMAATEDGVSQFTAQLAASHTEGDGARADDLSLQIANPAEDALYALTYNAQFTDATADADATDAVTIGLSAEGPEAGVFKASYEGTHYDQDGSTIYDGALSVLFNQDEQEITASIGTRLALGLMPDGVLLESQGIETIDPLSATAEQMTALEQSATKILENAAAIMMQIPALGAMLGGVAG